MTIDHSTLLFFDASCLIAAAGSSLGGSGFQLSLCGRGLLRGAVSQIVLLEAERNIRNKLKERALSTFEQILLTTPLIMAPVPPESEIEQIGQAVTGKDRHVVAAALAVAAPYLLTLDKQLEEQINQAGLSVEAFSPGGFIKSLLPQHVDYPLLGA